MHVAHLRGLGNSPAVLEPLPAVVGDCVYCVLSESAEHEEAGDGSARAALACVAVDDDDVVGVDYTLAMS